MGKIPRDRMTVIDRIRSRLDERRWRDYARSSTAVFYHWRPGR